MGRLWLAILICLLSAMNYAATLIIPLLGEFSRMYLGALVIATVWNVILLAAVCCRQGWARFVLALFLLSFTVAQITLVPDALVYFPALQGHGTQIIVALSLSNIFAACFLLVSKDIDSLSRPFPAKFMKSTQLASPPLPSEE